MSKSGYAFLSQNEDSDDESTTMIAKKKPDPKKPNGSVSSGYHSLKASALVEGNLFSEEGQQEIAAKGIETLLKPVEADMKRLSDNLPKYKEASLTSLVYKEGAKALAMLEKDYSFKEYAKIKKDLKQVTDVHTSSEGKLSRQRKLDFSRRMDFLNAQLKVYEDVVVSARGTLKKTIEAIPATSADPVSHNLFTIPYLENLKIVFKKFQDTFPDLVPAGNVAQAGLTAAAAIIPTATAAAKK